MAELKDLLGEELFDQVTSKIGDIKLILDEGNLIPKYRFDEINESKKNLQALLEQNNKELETLKSNFKGNEELQKQLQTLTEQSNKLSEEFKTKEVRIKKEFNLKESLLNQGVTDIKARELILKSFDVDTIELDETGKVKDFDNLIKPLKENPVLSSLFGQSKPVPPTHTGKSAELPKDFITREQYEAMTTEQKSEPKIRDIILESYKKW